MAKVEVAQLQYELENMRYIMKSGNVASRGIAAMWGSIGSRGRSFLLEDKTKEVEDVADAELQGIEDDKHEAKTDDQGNVVTFEGEETAQAPPSWVWSLWGGKETTERISKRESMKTSSGSVTESSDNDARATESTVSINEIEMPPDTATEEEQQTSTSSRSWSMWKK